jgi:hypothetical protein
LLLFNPIDLRGIPTANEDKTLAIWLKPKIFQMDPSDEVINILFLDEISAAPQSVQAAAYQITLDRVVGEHKLPENCIVIAAGNRTTDMDIYEELQDVLRLKYPNNSPEEMWNEFVMEQAMKCGMTDEQYDVWKARYIDNESPKSIAERLNMRRSNIDNLYSRGNMVLKEYIRNWLKNNS